MRLSFFSVLCFVWFACAQAIYVKAQITNDACSGAINLQSYIQQAAFGTITTEPFSNEGASGNDLDISGITGCWLDDLTGLANGSSPQIDATVWFRFEGFDGEIRIHSLPCDTTFDFLSEDTQMALYRGACDSLVLVACNEDLDAPALNYWAGIQVAVQSGADYYLVIDGFNYSGFGSEEDPLTTGEFCLQLSSPVVHVETQAKPQATVFPNPAQDHVTIQGDAFIEQLQLFDVNGRLLCALEPIRQKQILLPLPESAGLYVVRIITEKGIEVARIERQ